ncbi:putative cell morphogenesis protein, partial [Hortaea werneckii]
NHDYLVFSLEILTTLRSIIDALTPLALLQYPQLFWTTCACLDTIFEREFQEGLSMLALLLDKMDLGDPAVLKLLRESQPAKWEGGFFGIHSLLYKGLRSSASMERSLNIMESLIMLPSSDIVGTEERLLFTVLANLPRYVHQAEKDVSDSRCLESAKILAMAAEGQGHTNLAQVLEAYGNDRYVSEKDFLAQAIKAVREAFFPSLEFRSLVFLLGLVNNESDWFKVSTLRILSIIVPD